MTAITLTFTAVALTGDRPTWFMWVTFGMLVILAIKKALDNA